MADIINFTGKAWKHHIADDFENVENDENACFQNGAGAGSTIFLDYEEMIDYLEQDERKWYVAELQLINTPISFDFNCKFMATILVDFFSEKGFYPLRHS